MKNKRKRNLLKSLNILFQQIMQKFLNHRVNLFVQEINLRTIGSSFCRMCSRYRSALEFRITVWTG